VLRDFPKVQVSVLAATVKAGQMLYRSLTGRNAAPCPEKVGKLPLVTGDGRGACVVCGLCVVGRKGVVFTSSGR